MRSSLNRRPLTRCTAAALAALCLLASARGLVPQLCATLVEVQANAESCTTHACCAPQAEDESNEAAVRPHTPHVDCALCHIATARVLNAAAPVLKPSILPVEIRIDRATPTPPAPSVWRPGTPRAPPTLLA